MSRVVPKQNTRPSPNITTQRPSQYISFLFLRDRRQCQTYVITRGRPQQPSSTGCFITFTYRTYIRFEPNARFSSMINPPTHSTTPPTIPVTKIDDGRLAGNLVSRVRAHHSVRRIIVVVLLGSFRSNCRPTDRFVRSSLCF